MEQASFQVIFCCAFLLVAALSDPAYRFRLSRGPQGEVVAKKIIRKENYTITKY